MFANPKWNQEGVTVAGGRQAGTKLDQLRDPRGVAVNQDGTVFIADWGNHRIQRFTLIRDEQC